MVMQKLNTGTTAVITKILLGAVLLSALAGLVFTDVGGFFRNGVSRSDVAKVGGETISAGQFGKIYQHRIEQSGMDDKLARQMGVPNMVLQQEIERQVLLQAAQKSGIRISNAYVAGQLKKQLDNVKMVGTPGEKLQRVLMQQKMTEKELVDLLRADFSINLLGSAVSTGDMSVPPQMVLAAYHSDKQKRGADMITVALADVKNQKKLTDQDVQDYFKENKAGYRTNEARDIDVLIIPQALFAKDLNVADNAVQAFYNENKNKYLTPERVSIEQLIVNDEKTARKIMADKPASFEAYKKDNQHLAKDWYGKTGLPKEILAAIYPAKPMGLAGPIKTSLGYHILLIDNYDDAKPMAFDQAKDTIARQLKDEKLDTQMTAFTNEIDAMAESGTALSDIAAKYKLQVKHIPALQLATAKDQFTKAEIADTMQPRLQEAAFTLENDEMSPLMDTPSGDYALLQVTKIAPAAIPEFGAVAERVKQDATKARTNKAVSDLAESVMAKYTAKTPATFEQAVKAAGLTVQPLAPVTKTEALKQQGKQVAETLFGLDPSDGIASFQNGDKVTLVRLTKIVASTETPDDTAKTAFQESLRNTLLQELQQQFIQAWQKDIRVSVNTSLVQSMFSPQDKEQ